MRIVSDFDGVLTAQEGEAEAVGLRQLALIGEILGGTAAASDLLRPFQTEVRAQPSSHGWKIRGELTCYADEDPYVFHTAVAEVLYDQGPKKVVDALKGLGMEDANAFAGRCFLEGTEAWRASNDSHLVEETVALFQALHAAGVEVVVVSNSSTERIEQIFADFGAERFSGLSGPRVRGGARKFVVTPDIAVPVAHSAQFGPRSVPLQRGHYWEILNEEKPDLVIGDVLSLDLSLPATLRDEVPGFEGMKVCFRRAGHTPQWAQDAATARGIYLVDSLLQLPGILGI